MAETFLIGSVFHPKKTERVLDALQSLRETVHVLAIDGLGIVISPNQTLNPNFVSFSNQIIRWCEKNKVRVIGLETHKTSVPVWVVAMQTWKKLVFLRRVLASLENETKIRSKLIRLLREKKQPFLFPSLNRDLDRQIAFLQTILESARIENNLVDRRLKPLLDHLREVERGLEGLKQLGNGKKKSWKELKEAERVSRLQESKRFIERQIEEVRLSVSNVRQQLDETIRAMRTEGPALNRMMIAKREKFWKEIFQKHQPDAILVSPEWIPLAARLTESVGKSPVVVMGRLRLGKRTRKQFRRARFLMGKKWHREPYAIRKL